MKSKKKPERWGEAHAIGESETGLIDRAALLAEIQPKADWHKTECPRCQNQWCSDYATICWVLLCIRLAPLAEPSRGST